MNFLKLLILFICLQSLCLNAQYPGIYTFAGIHTAGYSGDGGPAINAQFNQLWAVAVDASGNVYVTDRPNQRIRKIDRSGIVSTFAGNGIAGFSGDGGPAANASLNHPLGLTFDAAGNLYIADSQNNRIRKVTPGGIISTVAGNGSYSTNYNTGGPATGTGLERPSCIAFDRNGNMYIGEIYSVRKVSPAGIISKFAGGNGIGSAGDGGSAVNATLSVSGIITDARGNVYISEGNKIRKVDAAGMISTYAGGGSGSGSGLYPSVGDGGPATAAVLDGTTAMAFDADSNLYIAENYHVRKVDPSGIISTYLGPYFTGFANAESFPYPFLIYTTGIAFDSEGSAYITNWGMTYHVLKTCDCATGINTLSAPDSYAIAPNPGQGIFTVTTLKAHTADQLILLNACGQKVHEQKLADSTTEVDLSSLPKGLFFYTLLKNGRVMGRGKLVIE